MEGPICGNIEYKGRTLFVAAVDPDSILRITEIKDATTEEPVEMTDDLMCILNKEHAALLVHMQMNTDEYEADVEAGIDPEGVGF
ncbi:MAG: hypothetical protein WC604_05110 [Candidatus Gracilibacteria bacterium]